MIWRLRITLEGQRGRLRGEVGDGKQGVVWARSFASAVRSLRDTAGSAAAGKAQHQPLTLRKDVGAATPQLAQAACTGEVLRSVLCEFVSVVEGGAEEVTFTVRLLDATVSGHRLLLAEGAVAGNLTEEFDLTYRRIEWEHRPAKTMAADEWA